MKNYQSAAQLGINVSGSYSIIYSKSTKTPSLIANDSFYMLLTTGCFRVDQQIVKTMEGPSLLRSLSSSGLVQLSSH